MGGGAQFAALWDRFNGDGVMVSYVVIYAISHLLCILLLGIALGRARIIPIWAATALILVSPLTIISSSVHIAILLYLAMTLRVIGCFPAALAMLKEGWPIPAKKV